jgi:small subunit ribosomal protein S14
MAKTSKIKKNEQRREIVARYAARRQELKAIIKNPTSSEDQRAEAYASLRKMPRDASPVRIRNRCEMSGRPRAYLRQFGLARIAFRDMALAGLIPGVRKASW